MSENKEKTVIIFVHGILGFSKIGFPRLGLSIEYFRGLRAYLSSLPVDLHFPELPPVGTIAQRAQVLADYVETLDSSAIHLVGHSMGGLDCRYLAAHLDEKKRVKSVTTVGTPHHGTPLSDWIVYGKGIFPAVARKVLNAGILDLTTDAMGRFNRNVPDRVDVQYSSYAGIRPLQEMPPWYRPWTRRIAAKDGANDSQVPASSARWGKLVKEVRADHFELVGWSLALSSQANQRPFDHRHFYKEIIEGLFYS